METIQELLGNEWQEYLKLIQERPEEFAQDSVCRIILDEQTVANYVKTSGRKIGILYQSPYNILVVDLVQSGNNMFPYERLLPRNKGAVVMLPVCGEKILLLDQYRHALRKRQYAFPRGFGEPGLSPLENAKKEIREEIDGLVDYVEYQGTIVADSGISGNRALVYLVSVRDYAIQAGYEGIQNVTALSRKELEQWIRDGKIDDGFTLAAYGLWNARNCS